MNDRRSKAERASIQAQMELVERRMRIGVVILFGVVLLAGVCAAVVFNRRNAEEGRSQLVRWDPNWPPLPTPKRRIGSLEHIQQAYAFTARREGVVQYLPCYCGCARQGHTSLRNCFIKSRTPAGSRSGTRWDSRDRSASTSRVTRDGASSAASRSRRFVVRSSSNTYRATEPELRRRHHHP